MRVYVSTNERERLNCELSEGPGEATITASNMLEAAADLAAALDDAAKYGFGECYWLEGGGEYRWMIRREGKKARVVVLWGTGVVTGWEHRYYAECAFEKWAEDLRAQLEPYLSPAS